MDLCPDDGVYLSELRRGSASFSEITQALLDCGLTATNAMDALGRLVDAGLATLET